MEQEEMFLYAAYNSDEQPGRYDGQHDVRPFSFELKRACMSRREGSTQQFKRIHIQFDPLSRQVCHVVVAFFNSLKSGYKFENQPRFVSIEETAEEAVQKKKEVDSGDYRNYAEDNKEKFDRCEVFEALITPN